MPDRRARKRLTNFNDLCSIDIRFHRIISPSQAPLTSGLGRELLEILDDRTGLRAICIASQLPFELWHEQMPDPTVADAVMDRILHRAHRIIMRGESMRTKEEPLQEDESSDK